MKTIKAIIPILVIFGSGFYLGTLITDAKPDYVCPISKEQYKKSLYIKAALERSSPDDFHPLFMPPARKPF